MIEYFDNVIYLTVMMVILSAIFHFGLKQDNIPISQIWFYVAGAWVGAAIVYIIK